MRPFMSAPNYNQRHREETDRLLLDRVVAVYACNRGT